VAQIVHDDVVARTHERGNGAVSGRPSGGIERYMLKPQQLGHVPLELQRQLGVAEQHG
jgi:hypothetical protein